MTATPSSIPFNLFINEPSFTDAMNLLRKEILLALQCHHIATIESFNPVTQTATATVNYTKTFYRPNANGIMGPYQVEYPLMIDCPVIFLGGGNSSLTFPVEEGDECIALFNDRDIDKWYAGAAGSDVATPRLHSFSDALLLVGIRSLANSLENFDMVRAVLQNGTTMVGVGPSLVKIANNTTTLNTQLQNLVTNIKALVSNVNSLVTAVEAITVICASPGSASSVPVNVAAITAVASQLSTTNSQLTTTANNIAGLLE